MKQSGQEAKKKRVTKAAGVRTGKRDQTKRDKAGRPTVLQEKEERFKSTINIISIISIIIVIIIIIIIIIIINIINIIIIIIIILIL